MPAVFLPRSVAENDYLKDVAIFDWQQFELRRPFVQVVAIAVCLAAGLLSGHPSAGMIAASGAMSVGFGSAHRIGKSCVAPMIFAAIGMSLSNLIGMVAGHSGPAVTIFAALWGFLYGILTALGGGTSWVGLQCTIMLLVSSAFPFTLQQASARAGMVLAGGALQVIVTVALLELFRRPGAPFCAPSSETANWSTIRQRLREVCRAQSLRSPACLYAARMALALGIAAEFYRHLSIASGYWIPMTALLVLKPDFRQTAARSLARVLGTILGAGCATLLTALLRPSTVTLAILVVFFAWWSYATLNVNYSLYAAFLTSYIVFLLAISTLPALVLVHRRTLCTILGGALAILIHIDLLRRPRTRPSPATSPG